MKTTKLCLIAILLLAISTHAQKRKKKDNISNTVINDKEFNNLKWRNIGPFRGGRSVASSGVFG